MKPVRKVLTTFAATAALAAAVPAAHAGMISSDAAQRQDERAHVKSLLARPDLAKQLEQLGIPAADAQARVDAMNDQEVHQLAGKVDTLAAGGQLSTTNTLLLVIALLLLIIVL